MKNRTKSSLFALVIAASLIAGSGVYLHSAINQINEPEVVEAAAEGNYWASVNDDGTVYGADFRKSLYDLMKNGKTTSYSSLKDGYLKYSDPGKTSGTFQPFYKTPGMSTASSAINKEHVWPNSRGAGESAGYAGTDPQVIRPTISADNSSRGNAMYGESSGWDPASCGYEKSRGESARIIFYAATRYYNESTASAGGSSKGSEPLELSDNTADASTKHTMGKLSDLIKWNNQYEVTAEEVYRNNYLAGLGFARNPFIDHPDWANYIWSVADSHDSVYQRTTSYSPTNSTAKLTGLTFTGTPTKTSYNAGDTFEAEGLTITAAYDDSSTQIVTAAVTWSPSPLTEGTTSVTGTFSKSGVSKTVTVSGLSVGAAVLDPNGYNLVTSVSDLTVGSEYLIASANSGEVKVMGTEMVATYYIGVADASVKNNQISYATGMSNFTLGGANGAYTFKAGSTYLGSAISGTHYNVLFSSSATDSGSTWDVSMANGGAATFLSSANVYLKYDGTHTDYTGYSTTNNVYLFKKGTVNNTDVPATSVTLDKTSSTLDIGGTLQLAATVAPNNATNKTIAFTSSDATVASVSSSGLVTALKAGTTTITAKNAANNLSATCAITVNEAASGDVLVASISLNKTSAELDVGSRLELTPTILPNNATNKTIAFSSGDATVASVSSSGVVSAIKAGQATITAKNEASGVSATCSITVKNVLVNSLTLNNTSSSLHVNDTLQLVATVSPENAADKSVVFSSSDATVASVSNSGLVTALKTGTATITAKNEASGICATCSINVVADDVVTIVSIDATSVTESLTFGETFVTSSIVVTATYSDESTKDVSASSSFSAINCKKLGSQDLVISFEGLTVSKSIKVTNKDANPSNFTVEEQVNAWIAFFNSFSTEQLSDEETWKEIGMEFINMTDESKEYYKAHTSEHQDVSSTYNGIVQDNGLPDYVADENVYAPSTFNAPLVISLSVIGALLFGAGITVLFIFVYKKKHRA